MTPQLVTASGDVYAWGLNDYGQLGLGKAASKNQTTPAKVEALSGIGVTQLSCGEYHTLALTAEGEVYSCGFGGSGTYNACAPNTFAVKAHIFGV